MTDDSPIDPQPELVLHEAAPEPDDGDSPGDTDEPGLDTLAGRLTYLFRTRLAPNGRSYSNEHVAEALAREQGVDISANYIWMLRAGRRDNPRLRHLQGLATFFGVPTGCLCDEDEAKRLHQRVTVTQQGMSALVGDPLARAATPTKSLNVLDELLTAAHALVANLQQETAP